MKRRSFLGLFSAAVVAPALPVAAPAAVTYSRSSYGLAVLHERTRPYVSARGLAHCLKLPKSQASTMMAEMTRNNLITLIKRAVDGSMRATINILISDPWGLQKTAAARKVASDNAKREGKSDPARTRGNIDLMLAHLHDLCVRQGMTLSPRCFAGQGGRP